MVAEHVYQHLLVVEFTLFVPCYWLHCLVWFVILEFHLSETVFNNYI